MSTTMLYKAPGPHDIHGGKFAYTIVPDADVEKALAEGWRLTTTEAKEELEAEKAKAAAAVDAASEASEVAKAAGFGDKKPSREDLEKRAAELKIEFGPRVSDRKLLALIAAAISEG